MWRIPEPVYGSSLLYHSPEECVWAANASGIISGTIDVVMVGAMVCTDCPEWPERWNA